MSTQVDEPGKNSFRKLLGNFTIKGPHGDHACLVHEPLGINMDQLLDFFPTKVLTLELIKPTFRQLLIGIHYLHNVARLIHTDLQPRNLLLPIDDPNVLSVFEQTEIEEPAPRKVFKDRTIYMSRNIPLTAGNPIICDFGEARFIREDHYDDDIMPTAYRAPEAWHLVSGKALFEGKNKDGIFDDRNHVAEMVAIMGPPPPEALKRSKVASVFWDEHVNWKGLAPIPDISLEKVSGSIRGEDKVGFLRFIRRMICWIPEDRPTPEELVFDPWLMEGLGNDQKKTNI